MRLRTIWTLPGANLKEKLSRTRELICQWLARCIPKRIRYWSTIQMLAAATRDSKNVPATPLDEILQHLEKGK